jgi:hypothetical protein
MLWEQLLKRDQLYFEGVEISKNVYENLLIIKKKVDQIGLYCQNCVVRFSDDKKLDIRKCLPKKFIDKLILEWYKNKEYIILII